MIEQYRNALDSGQLEMSRRTRVDRQQVHHRLVALSAGRLVGAMLAPVWPRERLGASASVCRAPEELELHPRVAQVMSNRAQA